MISSVIFPSSIAPIIGNAWFLEEEEWLEEEGKEGQEDEEEEEERKEEGSKKCEPQCFAFFFPPHFSSCQLRISIVFSALN